MTADLLIRDVHAVLPTGVEHVDIEVLDGRVAALAPAGSGSRARQVIDGGGREAFPGVIDPHVHFRLDGSDAVAGDDFRAMTRAAAAGGVTAVLAFVIAPPELAGLDAVRPVLDAGGEVAVDFGLHHVLWPVEENLRRLPELADAGVRTFKMFMAYPERGFMFEGAEAMRALAEVAAVDGLMLVHCEEGNAVRWADEALRGAKGAAATMDDYLAARPELLEMTAINLVGLWAGMVGCPLYVVHVSTGAGARAGAELIRRGADVTLETCPQYLVLEAADASRIGPLAKFAPVPRSGEDVDALWRAVAAGEIGIAGSDHAAHSGAEKERLAAERGIFGVPFGIPGLETLFPLLYTHGVAAGRLSREQLAELTSTGAARRFGWHPRKGSLQVGADADVVLVDPGEARAVDPARLRSTAGYSPYAGMTLRGWPSTTVLRGTVTFDGGELLAVPGMFTATDPLGRAAEPALAP